MPLLMWLAWRGCLPLCCPWLELLLSCLTLRLAMSTAMLSLEGFLQGCKQLWAEHLPELGVKLRRQAI